MLLEAGGAGKRSKWHAKVFTYAFQSSFPLRDAESSEMREIPPSRDDSVTYAVVQNRQVVRGRAVGGGWRGDLTSPLSPRREGPGWAPWWQRLSSGEGCPGPGMVRARAGASQLQRLAVASFQTRGLRLGPLDPRVGVGGAGREGAVGVDSGRLLTTLWLSQADYENVTPEVLDDEGIHYSELVHFGNGKRALAQEGVEYVTLKH